MTNKYEVIVIGSGPAGYVCAIKLAQLGLNCLLIEKDKLGGTCLNRGCIPTKALLHLASEYRAARSLQKFSQEEIQVNLDEEKINSFKDEIVDAQRSGVEGLLNANGVELAYGRAQIFSNKAVKLFQDSEVSDSTATKAIVVATGSRPLMIPIDGIEHAYSSDELLEGGIKSFNSLTIIGGGVIGVELASYYASIGKQVYVVEALDRLIARMDKDASSAIASQLKNLGVKVYTKSSVKSLEKK